MAEEKKTTTKKKEVKLNPKVWEVPYNEDLIAHVLYVYNSNERKGTAVQKGRGAVAGGGRKPWRQKGTGRARHGSIRSPLWIGGGVTFAKKGRNFTKKINKKMARKATCIMLSERLRNKDLEVTTLTPTKIKNLRKEVKGSNLIISNDEKVLLSLRNVPKVKIVTPDKLNAKNLVSARKVYVEEKNIKILESRLTNEK